MEAVEPGRHEEGRAVDRVLEAKGRVRVFVTLHAAEDGAEQDGQDEAILERRAIIVQQAVMRPGDRGARGQQDQRVEQRQMEGVEHFRALRRPVTAGELDARRLNGLVREQAGVEERPEPRDEKHDLGRDEQDHAVTVADLHDARVVALLGFLDDVGPPGGHDIENAEEARAEHVAAHVETEQRQGLHPHDRADGGHEGEEGPDDRPRARIDEMIIVVRFRVAIRHVGPLRLGPSGRLPQVCAAGQGDA